MKILSFREMYEKDYNLNHLFAINQKWEGRSSFSMWETPRKTSALLYFRNCSATYKFIDNNTLHVPLGSLVYLPQGSQYMTYFHDCKADAVHTQLLEFELIDEVGCPFSAMKQVALIDTRNSENYSAIFDELIQIYSSFVYSHSMMKAKVYGLLTDISREFHYEIIYSKEFLSIAKGILYLEKNLSYDKSIAEIAEMCHVSESGFRRRFQLYSGFSPREYKTQQLMRRAKAFLRSGDLTITEISAKLGYEDPAYFSKAFKKNTGVTPSEYTRRQAVDTAK